MTAAEAAERLAKISEVARDNEQAHSLEDELHRDVLRAISEDEGMTLHKARVLCEIALSSEEIDFVRWYA